MSEYIISQPAIHDLESISSYFADLNIEAGEKFLQGFNKRCQQLASFPNIGRSYDDLQVGLRGLPLEGYVILYRVTEDRIEIVRVVSGRQDLRSLFDKLN
ncbi:type II toxin-antitoxin system RelE/ParE family toxin [Chamaesiphon sp. GL140_3_metabinner_50]|uniref:type II toxin-antitoxin system RelE/ParE family toxin n=1 Tax=Chamaesiphon sp. GL140_3_metabinner_50 TaxID=2970812 RepID=UPI0025F309F0|nr:type II toxin-antitoxin system RelE/ParE family toxin [Chamaesiphon sp. GL140_3_metabinner_50]